MALFMFLENKYTRWYLTIVNTAKNQKRKKLKKNNPEYVYYEKHHIIPQSLGGTETVLLTAKEHFICHLLLCKMTVGQAKHKMINALIKMAYAKSRGQQRYVSRTYCIIKKLISEKNSEMFKGKPLSLETRSKMKGVNGKWKRELKHKQRMLGSNNPSFGKTGANNVANREDVRLKISQSKLGRKRVYKEDGLYYYERKI